MRCNMLKHSLQRREVENQLVFERSLLPRQFLGSRDDKEALFTESRDATGKTVNPDTDKTCSDNFGHTSSSGGCETQWMSRDEGSDRQSRSLVCSSVIGVEDARMTSIKEREIGWCENLSRADECSPLVKLSRFMSIVL